MKSLYLLTQQHRFIFLSQSRNFSHFSSPKFDNRVTSSQ